jgi:hypothetical protein
VTNALLLNFVDDLLAWFMLIASKLVELLKLPPNWDSYGARPIDPIHVRAALQVLLRIMGDETPMPFVVPTNRGGIQMEWHVHGLDLEIETVSAQRIRVSFEDEMSSEEWEADLGTAVERLTAYLLRLSIKAQA